MRIENTKITLTMHIPIGAPDCNGVVFTKEAIENSLDSFKHCPIVFNDTESELTCKVLGVTTGNTPIVTWDADNQGCNLTLDGILFYSGAKIIVHKLKDNKITKCDFASVGLTI